MPLELLRQQGGSTSRYWYEEDGRGNVVALTDSSGNVVDRYAYDAWGAPTSVSESVIQPLRYAGYWWDAALGWYWVGVRPYDPALKRWLQPDPSGQDGMRTYVYANDNPIDVTDPSGQFGNPFSDPCDVWVIGRFCGRNTAGDRRALNAETQGRPIILIAPGKKSKPATYYVYLQGNLRRVDRGIAVRGAHIGVSVAIAAGFFFRHAGGGSGSDEADIVILYRSPSSIAEGEKVMSSGFDPNDFPGEGAYFYRVRSAAAIWSNNHARTGVIKAKIPASLYEELKNTGNVLNPNAAPDEALEVTEVIVPPDQLARVTALEWEAPEPGEPMIP